MICHAIFRNRAYRSSRKLSRGRSRAAAGTRRRCPEIPDFARARRSAARNCLWLSDRDSIGTGIARERSKVDSSSMRCDEEPPDRDARRMNHGSPTPTWGRHLPRPGRSPSGSGPSLPGRDPSLPRPGRSPSGSGPSLPRPGRSPSGSGASLPESDPSLPRSGPSLPGSGASLPGRARSRTNRVSCRAKGGLRRT